MRVHSWLRSVLSTWKHTGDVVPLAARGNEMLLRPDERRIVLVELEPRALTRAVDEDYLDDIAAGFAQVVDAKSPFTAGHSDRVALFADLIAEEMGYTPERRRWLKRAALLHDIGKLGVSNSVLDKNGKPDDEEWAEIKRHPELGRVILSKIAAFHDMARIAGDHHEKLNGRGYPHGIKANAIDLDTRIVTVADIFDALTAPGVILVDDTHPTPHENEPRVLNAQIVADERELAAQADPLARRQQRVRGRNEPHALLGL